MSKIEQYSRIQHHRTTIANQQFTVPTSNDHTDETWISTDLYIGEIGINVTSNTAYFRSNNGIIQLGTTASGSGGAASLWDYSGSDFIVGATYSPSSVSPRSGVYTDLGTTALRWKDLYLGGAANGRTQININGGMLLTEISSNGILSSGYDSNDNSPIQIYGTSSNVSKSRPIHINSYNSIITSGNQKASIASKNIVDNSIGDSFVAGQNVTLNTGITSSAHIGDGYGKTNYFSSEVSVGNLAVRGISDDGSGQYAKSDWTTRQSLLRTTTALTYNLATIPWSNAEGGDVIQVKANILGSKSDDATKVYSASIMCSYAYATFSGSASVIPTGLPVIEGEMTTWVGTVPFCDMDADSTGVRIKITGVNGDTTQWLCSYSFHRLINITL